MALDNRTYGNGESFVIEHVVTVNADADDVPPGVGTIGVAASRYPKRPVTPYVADPQRCGVVDYLLDVACTRPPHTDRQHSCPDPKVPDIIIEWKDHREALPPADHRR